MEHYPIWRMILDISNFVITWGVAIYVYFDKRKKQSDHRFDAVSQRFEAQAKRFEAVDKNFVALDKKLLEMESAVKHPDCARHQVLEDKLAQSNGAFNKRLDDLHGDIRELTGSVKGLNRAVDLMNEYLINKKG
jgi:hypothetical protein